MLSVQTITPNTLELLTCLAQQPELKAMRLVGGTALALQYGHRVSVDLDFFSDQPVELDNLVTLAKRIGDYKITNKTNHILQLNIKQVKVDFVDYSCYQWIDQPVVEEGVVLASDKDIASLQVNAIINRGTKKDFVDLFVLLQHYSLSQIMDFYRCKYPDFSDYRALMSLTYFDDAETMDMPQMRIPNTWDEMKKTIASAVKEYQA